MQTYQITMLRKLGMNRFSDEEPVGQVEADLLGPAKRFASEYINNWLIDRKLAVRTRGDWAKDVKRSGFSREIVVTENGQMAIMVFVLREA